MKTALKIVSVLQIIAGILTAVLGLSLTTLFAMGADEAGAGGLVVLAILLLVVSGVVSIISGVLGLRAAKDPSKAMPAVVLGGISLALSIVSLATSFSLESLAQCVIPAVYFGCALGLKSSASQGDE